MPVRRARAPVSPALPCRSLRPTAPTRPSTPRASRRPTSSRAALAASLLGALVVVGPALADEAAAQPSPQPSAEGQAAPATVEAPAAGARRGLDARTRALADDLALSLKRLPGDHRDQLFAVMPFDEAGEEAKKRQLGLVVSDLVVTNLARDHRLPLAERAALKKIIDEQALGELGAIEPSQAAGVGKLAGVRAMVVGQVAEAGEVFRITARVVDVETAAVLATAEASVPADELIAFSADALVLRSKSGAMFRSLALPGWGQSYNGEPVKAWVLGGTTGALAASTLAVGTLAVFTGFLVYPRIGLSKDRPENDFFDAAFVPRGATPQETQTLAEQTRATANVELGVAGVLAALTATAWVFGALDAYVSGTDVESLDKALATN